MTALAVFIEGQTELIFVEKLLFEMLGYQGLRIVREVQHGNFFHEIGARGAPDEDAEHTVLLCNCACDGKVLPAIEERAILLYNKNYDRVLGLRDIYPEPSEDLEEIYELIRERLMNLPLPCEMIIAVREVEAWFLKDTNHFAQINSALTAALILERLSINIEEQDMEQVPHPSALLDRIYQLVGRSYSKKDSEVHAVVSVLDYDYLYLDAPSSVPSLKRFLDALNSAL